MQVNGGDGRPTGNGAYSKLTLGPGAHEGAVYAVAGSSGKISGGALNHPAMFISLNDLGSMSLDVDGNRLDANFIRENGAIADSFTIIKGSVENSPPAVNITSPANGAGFNAPATISIEANATDADGTVTGVDFYANASLIGTDTTEPYSFTWTNVPVGSYALTAKATDNSGAETTSGPVNITVNPVVTTPAAPTGLTATAVSTSQINLAWTDNASNEDGFKIERSNNGVSFIQIAVVGPNETTFSSTGLQRNKTFHYRVRAYNASGNSAYSNTASAKTRK
jgi:predicted phage tail protein